jgi:hypothetical protein
MHLFHPSLPKVKDCRDSFAHNSLSERSSIRQSSIVSIIIFSYVQFDIKKGYLVLTTLYQISIEHKKEWKQTLINNKLSSEVPGWLNKEWQEDFMVIWNVSFCVEIRCREETSEERES